MHSLNTMHSSGHTLHTDVSEEKCLDVIHGLYIQSESANIALEHNFLRKHEALIVPLILLLSLSLCPPAAMS